MQTVDLWTVALQVCLAKKRTSPYYRLGIYAPELDRIIYTKGIAMFARLLKLSLFVNLSFRKELG